ncbi:dynein beta chain, ciliary isoform X1 [Hydra vulgaris]|uniref:dynein beta chain, ciliary isoform X1 n=1 Tax=Hydra vulgaris TaxID=6087 RepID=UPI001F5EE46A|nr:dynein beta chain, ciliary [Hydra vulgaris]
MDFSDIRFDFLSEFVLKTFKLKADKWTKLLGNDEYRKIVLEFFEKTDSSYLFITLTSTGLLVPSYFLAFGSKTKTIYFIKKDKSEIITKDKFKGTLIVGDLSSAPLDQLSAIVDEVFVPLLSNEKNQTSWPDVVSQDILHHAIDLKNNVFVISGQYKGRTLLPLPIGLENLNEEFPNDKLGDLSEANRLLIHRIESVVIDWTHQISKVLKKSSAQPLIEGLNPGPLVELNFWKSRSINLENIFLQLQEVRVKKMAKLLQLSNSSYYSAFKKLFKSVVLALDEAYDINMHLKPLRRPLEELDQLEISEINSFLCPLMHAVGILWAKSKYYCKPGRIVVLLQEIGNFLIYLVRNYLDPSEIFKCELEESSKKIEIAISMLQEYKIQFENTRNILPSYFKDEQPIKKWEFASDLVFTRYDLFINRLKLVQDIFQTTIEFNKLEKVEIGGMKGRILSHHVIQIFTEFQENFRVFANSSYDSLNPSDVNFDKDYHKFQSIIKDLDIRLAAIINHAFNNCSCLEAKFKLIDIFGSLLDRPLIAKSFESKYEVLLKMVEDELDQAKIVFDNQVFLTNKNKQVIGKNMPCIAGILRWCQQLHLRYHVPVYYLKMSLNRKIMQSKIGNVILEKYEEMNRFLKSYEDSIYSKWTSGVNVIADQNLNKPLIVRNKEKNLIYVNFDPQLVAVLREVKYLEMTENTALDSIPECALAVFERNNEFNKYCANLDLIVAWYNKVCLTVLDVEYPLIKNQLDVIDRQLKEAEDKLNWNSQGIWEYIDQSRDMVHQLEQNVQSAKSNVAVIKTLMSKWSLAPLYDRKDGKKDGLLYIEDKPLVLKKRYDFIKETGDQIFKLVLENKNAFSADAESEIWKSYIEYLDDMVVEGFLKAVHCSLQFILTSTDAKLVQFPLFESRLELQAPDLIFVPPLDFNCKGCFFTIVEEILSDIYSQASLINRLASHYDQPNYQYDIEVLEELSEMRTEILEHVSNVMNKACDYRNSFHCYEYLWTDERNEFMNQFLKYGRTLTLEELERHGEGEIPESSPTLQQFKEQIGIYERLYAEIEEINGIVIFDGWFRVDVKPFKQALLNIVKRWSFMFKQYLIDHVQNSLTSLSAFIKTTDQGLLKPVQENDLNGLVECMGHLMAVKDRTQLTDAMFEPLKQTIELLKSYNQELSEEIHTLLQELPEKWNNTKKICVTVKQYVAPLQANEVAIIRRNCISFDVRQHEFREEFRKTAPLNFDSEDVYKRIDEWHNRISDLEAEMQGLHQSASLFEVNVPDFKQLKACGKEVVMLKSLWDMIGLVLSNINHWKTTLWSKIDVDTMEVDCKSFVKEIRTLDKEMKAWDAFNGLDCTVKNMITSLRSISELQNPALRERHWQQLMKATKVRFLMNENTTLADLLALNLHKFEDEVHNIVDKATKELSMEKVIAELNNTWSVMLLEYEEHHRTKIKLLKTSEELIEVLEDNQVQLQNLMTSKYIGHFLVEVSGWQKKLSTVDAVLSMWMEVQRTWSHLESIFIGSDDIRAQLPEDSARFDGIDFDFKEMCINASQTPNVVLCCTKPNLYEKLENVQARLSLCEKALAEYLETKRLAFPRFYFVSPADLLDILSKGNQPLEVCRHLAKLFDNMSTLEFTKDNDGVQTKQAIGMYSKENEYVKFNKPFMCTGQVETWLTRLLNCMQETIRHELSEAVVAYEEKPRDHWLFDYPAQVALCGTQIWWTTEVGISFNRLEEGYENAMKDYYKKQITQLTTLITMLVGDLSPGDRQKIMTICTIDVHARDVIAKLIQQKVENSQAFLWLSQLRHRWDDHLQHCFVNICDAQFKYFYEYLGNTPRLVITPLTDRCYITLTQSLHLNMSGAPAGPAGTGKTETTKDLGRALGIIVYVFNCSEQMDYKSCGNIYKGLAQSGAWGCFDEFNRISIEVLSVIAVQVKSIQDAIRDKKKRFIFQGEEISLIPTVGMWITMNPGYAGRTELPENLKCLFRPCAMVVPDFELICEIMLVAEGFVEAKMLARKFITLYTLCKELLSKQDHYDWGLRAIKSVLVVAGTLKRGDRARAEDQVLMRALRDFNIPKIVTDDLPVFMGLIYDLFPSMDVPRNRNLEFEAEIRKAVLDLKLQPEDSFVLKIVQLQELVEVRHSVFVIGAAGTGKSQVIRSLNRTYFNQKKRPYMIDMNPKAVTADELFGFINPATREWKDGLFSVAMRDLSNIANNSPKWIVLDGDIDPMWIESLNTVMDDNKVLTLASNERVPLTPSMRLIFEIGDLKTATPATVSRAGILFLNYADVGWNPYVQSWIDKREVQSEKANLHILFDKYVPVLLDAVRTKFKKITPIVDISMVQMLCYLLEVLFTPENTPPDSSKELYELYFVFASIWAFGGSMFQDQLIDYRAEFSKWWVSEFKGVKFPSSGTVFDYCIDVVNRRFVTWADKVPQFEFDPEMPLQAVLVHTSETIRIRYFMDLLMEAKRPIMLIGNAGCGKTVLVGEKFASLDPDKMIVANVPFNFYTTSAMLQQILEKPLEKKAGRNYGPPGAKRLVYFIDDMNMPKVDTYGTVQPHTLIRQHLDYNHWYDRQKLTLKEVHNCQYVACMNPTAGSFTINSRLQRHFCVFAISFPSSDALKSIYSNILSGHLTMFGFSSAIQKIADRVIDAAIVLNTKITMSFLPTAFKFHYVFNLRDLSNIFQGLLFSTKDSVKAPVDLVRLWNHECNRVYRDKFLDNSDTDLFDKIQADFNMKMFDDLDTVALNEKPLLYSHFAKGIGDPKYNSVSSWGALSKLLVDALDSHNEVNAVMNLVLFEDAMSHICRINRILESPRGNALLVGVGGSGKQSLARLAAYISALEVFQITLRKGYSIADLKVDLGILCYKSGVKNIGTVFILTDAQVPEENFLVLINDLLASGEIPGLYADEEVENIINAIRNEVKGAGIQDTRENCWKFFVSRVRRQLKVVLCFSPVGNTLRIRSRKFPALTNCTSINWFHEWPEEALVSVSKRFLDETEQVLPEQKQSVAEFLAYTHTSVNLMSQTYLVNERRYNYTTPKSFLEQISLYKNLIKRKSRDLLQNMERLENGLTKLQSTAQQVDDLKSKLASQEIELAQKNEDADALIKRVGIETEKVSKEKAFADDEEKKVAVFAKEVGIKQVSCETDLAKAEPALAAAQEALNTLNKNNLTELKSFGTPPPAVVSVTSAVMVLLAPDGKVPKDRSWKAAKVMMGKVDQFLDQLINYNKENIHENCLKAVQPYLDDPQFNADFIRAKSGAAAGLCAWVVNIVTFYRVFCDVEPKRKALAQANSDLAVAEEKLSKIKAKIKELDANLAELTASFEQATSAKLRCQKEAERTSKTIELANRLVGGLASENIRWAESVLKFKKQAMTLPGDVLLISAFISYVGSFSKVYREDLSSKWLTFLREQKVPIPITNDLDPLTLLTDNAMIAQWNNDNLPSDRMSTENATILLNAERWPLMIDPQLQGIKWIKTREQDLKVVRLGQKGYLDIIESGVSNGDCVLIESIGESLDPVLDPILGRNTIKKGRYIKLGDKEIEYNPNFRLILMTKLANPHYKPEMQAQTTLINFTVTKEGLEDQLLANVVAKERPDLEESKSQLTQQQNRFTIILKELEDSLLARLSSAAGNFLGDYELVENLETTKRTAADIEEKSKEAKVTEIKINEAREMYRSAAARSSLLYFILNDLNKINLIYQFSLKAFSVVFEKAIEKSAKDENVKIRVNNLIDCITYTVFVYTTRGLFEKDKLIFMAQVAFQILLMSKEIVPEELNFLLRFPIVINITSPVDFLSNSSWGGVKALSAMEDFRNLDHDIEGSAKRWKKFIECECPEKEKFPQEWKNKTSLQKLCMMRAFRPDRMTYAIKLFVEEKLGSKYVEDRQVELSVSYEESGPATPIFFILSPGVDPLKDVEFLGKKMGFSSDNKNLHSVSLGQGQEIVAEKALDLASKEGHWVVLQNIHLVKKWLPTLEKKIELYSIGSHPHYRLFMSAEPAPTRDSHCIPQGILEVSIKITNEPPTGMMANVHKALDNFNQETLEMCARENEFKSILFSLCYFHAVVAERRKFGPQGWNRSYPFNTGDLTISVYVLYNYLEANAKVPWTDLRYLFGEIMYGGHITDDWDRRLCRTYLEEYMKPEMIDGDLFLAPNFPIPTNMDYIGYHSYVNEVLPPESPNLYGLHPNAEIGFLTSTSENLFKTILELQPRDSSGVGGGGQTRDEKVKQVLDEILEKLPESFGMMELMAKAEERTPYTVVALQEADRMNVLTNEIRVSLKELDLGLKGELTITNAMEELSNSLFFDEVPKSWSLKAYPSMYSLGAWFIDLLLRNKDLDTWTGDFNLPSVVWLSGLFNPQSFITAVMQSMARKNEWPLDRMTLQVDVTKKNKEDFTTPPREGAYVHGCFMEGARWDTQLGMIADSRVKELTPQMPVLFLRAIPVDKQDTKNSYECPVYKTRQRGPTYVWNFHLKTKENPAKWILAGVALLLSV